jgi:hypothetical protein
VFASAPYRYLAIDGFPCELHRAVIDVPDTDRECVRGEVVLLTNIGRLFVWLSGADYDILAAQHGRVRARYVGTGTGIVITGMIAGLSMWFALTTALGIPAAAGIPLAACWSLAIMSIDRWLVVSLERRGGRGLLRYLVDASPRLALAIVLGFVISTPITLRVFQKEINLQLEQMQNANLNTYLKSSARMKLVNQITAEQGRVASLASGGTGTSTGQEPAVIQLGNQLTALNKQLASDITQETNFYNAWQCEAYGVRLPNGSSCPVGNGPLAAAAENSYNTYKADVLADNGNISALQARIKRAEGGVASAALEQLPAAESTLATDQDKLARQDTQFEKQNVNDNGLLAQINGLDAAAAASPGLQAGRWLLFLVFFLIDCLPALMAITHALNDQDDYEKAVAAATGTREKIAKTHMDDLLLDAESLSQERAARRGATAKALADAEQQVKLHKARQWANRQTRPDARTASRRAARRVGGRAARAWQQNSTPPAQGTPQVFIRRYTPPDPTSRNGHAPGSPAGGMP